LSWNDAARACEREAASGREEAAMQDREYRWDEPTREEIDRTRGPLVLEFGTPW
jgi:hypothetical protein